MTDPQNFTPLKGSFLLAMPSLKDLNFSQAVVCMCESSDKGAMGLIVNRQYSTLFAKELFKELDIDYFPEAANIPIYNGGPVNSGEVFVLHGPPFDWNGCLIINDWLALSNTRDILEMIAIGEGPKSFLIALGYSGWASGQLEEELKGNCWLTCPVNPRIIFELPEDARWAQSMKLMNIDPALLTDTAGNA